MASDRQMDVHVTLDDLPHVLAPFAQAIRDLRADVNTLGAGVNTLRLDVAALRIDLNMVGKDVVESAAHIRALRDGLDAWAGRIQRLEALPGVAEALDQQKEVPTIAWAVVNDQGETVDWDGRSNHT